jgi:hypothetical protein
MVGDIKNQPSATAHFDARHRSLRPLRLPLRLPVSNVLADRPKRDMYLRKREAVLHYRTRCEYPQISSTEMICV